jgi:lysophospholipase L1-like esterase
MRARLAVCVLLVACGADAQHVGGEGMGVGAMDSRTIGSGFGRPSGVATTIDLNGQVIGFADECSTTKTIYTEEPRASVAVTRASDAWCTKSDGTMVLVSSNQPRRERLGLLLEPASTGNSIVDPRDLTTGSWTRTNITAAKTATGPDGVTNSATTITASANNGTVTQTVTTAAATRSSSMRIRRRTGTGAVYVSRNNFGAETNIGALIDSTWRWVRATCGTTEPSTTVARVDRTLSRGIPNCIPVSSMTGSVLNPTIGIKIAVSGDAVDVDMVQDEAASFATSPQTGFTRAADVVNLDASASLLPVNNAEFSADFATMWTADGASGDHFPFSTYTAATAGVLPDVIRSSANVSTTFKKTGVAGDSLTTGTLYSYTGIAQNYRWSFGSVAAKARFWVNGNPFAEDATATSIPDAHGAFRLGGSATGTGILAGWLSRFKAASTASYLDGKGSDAFYVIVGDSIVKGSPTYNTNEEVPAYVLSGLTGAGLYSEKYVWDDGVSSRTITQCETAWNAWLAKIASAATEDRAVLLLQCGTNSLTALGAAAVWAVAETMLDDAVAAGVKVQPATITPASGAPLADDFNVFLFAWCTANNIECADTYSVLDDPASPGTLLPAYSGDGLHPNAAGTAVMTAEWHRAGVVNGYW